MAAALGGMVSRPEADGPAQGPEARTEDATVAPVRPIAPSIAVAPVAPEMTNGDRESEYRRTGTGYVRTDGTELVRTVVLMTESERRRLKMEAMGEGMSASDYVRRALGFLPDAP